MNDQQDLDTLPGTKRMLQVVRRLRSEDGCPWDREQTLQSLKQYLLEECHEVMEAIDDDDLDRHREELGDLLLQVALQARLREESGHFNFDNVARELADKLVRRHPHVFGDVHAPDSKAVLHNWEKIKATEKGDSQTSIVDGIPPLLPALQKAHRVQSRVSHVGFDWADVKDVLAKIDEELEEVRQALDTNSAAAINDEVGDLLFSVVNLCRFLGINAEDALGCTVKKFVHRFKEVENRLTAEGRDIRECTLADMDAHWEAIKSEAGC